MSRRATLEAAWRVGGVPAILHLVPPSGLLHCPAAHPPRWPTCYCGGTGRVLLLEYPPQREARATGRNVKEHELAPATVAMRRFRQLLALVTAEENRLHEQGHHVPADPIIRAILRAGSYATASRAPGEDNRSTLNREAAAWEHALGAIAHATKLLAALELAPR